MMWWMAMLLHIAHASDEAPPEVLDKIQNTRASISEDERRAREALSHLFTINKKVKDIARKQEQVNTRMLGVESSVRSLAQDVGTLERRTGEQKGLLNKRLRQLYQERNQDDFHWMFSAHTPIELERNHRFLRRMIDNDHKQLKLYLVSLETLNHKRTELKKMVAHLALLQKEVQKQEQELSAQMREKAKFIAELKKSQDKKLAELKGLRTKNTDAMSYAFFEKRGGLRGPIEVPLSREYGTYVDPQFRFRLTHKGLFYGTPRALEVKSVFHGRVVLAQRIPGYGKTVIVDHGDNYYSVYAFASQLKVREGAKVQEGDLVALSGEGSPLFGPGLYFEIRHFTDAIDPRPWIKDSVLKTADSF
jgi:septal ring factor EnvC (AmiA/AmiB activator)